MSESNLKARQLARLAVLGGIACMVAGCGWTARDEFYRNRSLVLAPQAGDGSQITSTIHRPGAPATASPQFAQTPTAAGVREAQ